jgi:hypothetical protein
MPECFLDPKLVQLEPLRDLPRREAVGGQQLDAPDQADVRGEAGGDAERIPPFEL